MPSLEYDSESPEHLEPVVVWSLKRELMFEPVRVSINRSHSAQHPRYHCLVVAVLPLSALHLVAVCVRWPLAFFNSHPSGMLVSRSGW